MRRAEYDRAVAWIAADGAPADCAKLVALVADLFGVGADRVAEDVGRVLRRCRGAPMSRVFRLIERAGR